jgi:hypothetical protein
MADRPVNDVVSSITDFAVCWLQPSSQVIK